METKDNVQTHYLVHVVAYRRHPVNIGYFFLILFIYFWLCWVPASARGPPPPQLRQAGATLHRGARAPHYRGLSRCGAQAPDAQAAIIIGRVICGMALLPNHLFHQSQSFSFLLVLSPLFLSLSL